MSKPNEGGAPNNAPEEELKQLKSEFSRKTDNLTKELLASQAKIDQLMQAVLSSQQSKQTQTTTKSDDIDDIDIDPIDDPKGYAKAVAKRAEARAERRQREFEERLQRQQQEASQANSETQQTLNKLVVDYPELNDRSSELYIKTQELMATMPNTAVGIRAAVREAAAELDIKIASKRKRGTSEEDFTVSGGSSSGSSSTSKRGGSGDTKISEATLQFAELMGRPVDDPEYQKRLKSAASRTRWGKYK